MAINPGECFGPEYLKALREAAASENKPAERKDEQPAQDRGSPEPQPC